MISGWAGTGISDLAIMMPTPEKKLRLRAGGYPLVRTLLPSVPFPTRVIEERQLVTLLQGGTVRSEFGWEIEFKRNDAFGSAIVEIEFPEDIPMIIEHCPDVTDEDMDEAALVSAFISEPTSPISTFEADHACGVLVVTEE